MSAEYNAGFNAGVLHERQTVAAWLDRCGYPLRAAQIRKGEHQSGNDATPSSADSRLRKEIDDLSERVDKLLRRAPELELRVQQAHDRIDAMQRAADTQANAILTDLRAIVARMEKRK